ncbi:MAG: DUF2807 domain-containing protein, partial [Candidatus Limnocylindrales bacterium]
ALVVTGCSLVDVQTIRGSGTVVTEEFELVGFEGLDVSRGWDVSVVADDDFGLSVSADDNVSQYLEIELDDTILRLDIDDSVNLRDATVAARIAMPTVRSVSLRSGGAAELTAPGVSDDLALRLTGGSQVACSAVSAGTVTVELAGGSDVTCTELAAEALRADLAGGSALRVSGDAATAELVASGNSQLELSALEVAGASVVLSGGSRAELTVSGVLAADVTNGSALRYAGDPVLGAVDVDQSSSLEALAS